MKQTDQQWFIIPETLNNGLVFFPEGEGGPAHLGIDPRMALQRERRHPGPAHYDGRHSRGR